METSDKRILDQLVDSLGELSLGRPALEQVREPLYRLLRSEMLIYYAVETTPAGSQPKGIGGFSEVSARYLQGRHLRELPGRFRERWPPYNPLRVAPSMQNRVSAMSRPAPDDPWARHDAILTELGPELGLGGYDQLRALVCDGPALLYWLGAMRKEPYSPREVRILERLVPHLARRLRLERAVEDAPSLSLLAGILDRFGAPAFLLGPRGAIECANELGVRLWERDRRGLFASLEESRGAGGGAPFEVTPIAGPEGYHLAVERRPPVSTAGRVEAAARRWALTPRQREVLALVVAGQTNWQISAGLGCAERTVEIHVSAILKRAELDNRAGLIAEVLRAE